MPLHIATPLIHSLPLSRLAGRDVWLKMESSQPSGSFKLRGGSWRNKPARWPPLGWPTLENTESRCGDPQPVPRRGQFRISA